MSHPAHIHTLFLIGDRIAAGDVDERGCCRNRFKELHGHRPTATESATHSRAIRRLVDDGLVDAHYAGTGLIAPKHKYDVRFPWAGTGEPAIKNAPQPTLSPPNNGIIMPLYQGEDDEHFR